MLARVPPVAVSVTMVICFIVVSQEKLSKLDTGFKASLSKRTEKHLCTLAKLQQQEANLLLMEHRRTQMFAFSCGDFCRCTLSFFSSMVPPGFHH